MSKSSGGTTGVPAGGINTDWSHTTAEIAAKAPDLVREATPEQLEAAAKALDILSVERLFVRYKVEALGGGRYQLAGELKARVVQACVVTLDPVTTELADRIEAEFWPADRMPADPQEAEQAALEAVEHEPIVDHRLEVGRVILETLQAALPAFPRAEAAELEKREAGPGEGALGGAFAQLSGWKPKT